MYKVLVIGLGRVGAAFENDTLRQKPASHLGAWLAHSNRCQVVAVSDTNTDAIANHRPPGAVGYLDYEDAMNKGSPDIVSIATPDETHLKIARVVMRYDPVKLVFLEKPIALQSDHAQQILDTAREFKVKLAINHTRRWSPLWRAVADECNAEPPTFMTGTMTGGSGGIRDVVHIADLGNWFNPKVPMMMKPAGPKSPYLTFEVDLFWDDKRIRVTENGRVSTMYKPQPSHYYDDIRELEPTCHVNRSLYPKTDMYLATQQLLDCLDKDDEPYCTGEHGKRALETFLKWSMN